MPPAIMRNLLVVLPGILGSELRKEGRPIWAPGPSVLGMLATLRRNLDQFKLPAGIGDGGPGDGVEAVGLIPDLTLVPGLWSANIGYTRLLGFLRSRFELIEAPLDDPDTFANFLPFAYDWRLSSRCNARRLKPVVERALEKWRSQSLEFADAKVVFVCHSMGGLVARSYVHQEGGAEYTRRIITLGTPHRGAMKSLVQLVNGTRLGPLAADLTLFARSLPSMHELLPQYACIETDAGLATLDQVQVPELDAGMVRNALALHRALDQAQAGGVELVPFVGFRQPTATTAGFTGGRVIPLDTIEGADEGGDGTVPRLAATPAWMEPSDPAIRGVAEQHMGLPGHESILDDLQFALGAFHPPHRAGAVGEIAVRMDDVLLAGESLTVEAQAIGQPHLQLLAVARDERGRESARATLRPAAGRRRGVLKDLAPGAHLVTVLGADGHDLVQPVATSVLVWEQEPA